MGVNNGCVRCWEDGGEKRKCHIFAILRQRYGKAGDWEKTQKRGVVKNAKLHSPANPQRGLYADCKHLRQFGGVVRALVFGLIDLRCLFLGCGQLGSEQDGVAPCLFAYLVDGALQGSVACAVAFVKEVGNDRALGDDTREDDPRFLELHALAEIGAERIEHIGE